MNTSLITPEVSERRRSVSEKNEIKPFAENDTQRAAAWKDLNLKIQKVSLLIRLLNAQARFIKITSVDELKQFIQSPRETFANALLAQSNSLPERLKKLITEGKISAGGGRKVEIPEDFNQIEELAANLKEELSLKFIDIIDGEVIASPTFFEKQINKSCFFAITASQKRRLEYASQLLATLELQDEIFRSEIREANQKTERFERMIDEKVHIGPLPIALRYDVTSTSLGFEKKIALNESWIVFGSKREFPELKTGSTPGETFKLGHINGRPILLPEDKRAPEGATMFPYKYTFVDGFIARQNK